MNWQINSNAFLGVKTHSWTLLQKRFAKFLINESCYYYRVSQQNCIFAKILAQQKNGFNEITLKLSEKSRNLILKTLAWK